MPDTAKTDARRALASDLLWEHGQSGVGLIELPEGLRPQTRAEGFAIQGLLERRSRFPLWGWKIAATSAAGQAHIGVDAPLPGRLLAEMVLDPEAVCSLSGNRMHVAEPEFAFKMGKSLLPRQTPFSAAEVLDAIATFHPAIEIPNSRFLAFDTVGSAQLIADNACANRVVLGPAARMDWQSVDLASHPVVMRCDGHEVGRGSGANVLGDPIIALSWLANELRELGAALLAGQVVITGACAPPVAVRPGMSLTADFGTAGLVSVGFAE